MNNSTLLSAQSKTKFSIVEKRSLPRFDETTTESASQVGSVPAKRKTVWSREVEEQRETFL